MSLSHSPLKAQRSMQRREMNVYKSPRWYMTLRKQCLPESRADTLRNPQRQWQWTQDLCRLKSGKSHDKGVGAGMKSHLWPTSYCQQIAARKKKVNFLQWSDTGHISCIPRQVPCSGGVNTSWTPQFLERENMKLGWAEGREDLQRVEKGEWRNKG